MIPTICAPILNRFTAMGEASERGETPPWLFPDGEALYGADQYPKDLREIAIEQVRRYAEVLGKPLGRKAARSTKRRYPYYALPPFDMSDPRSGSTLMVPTGSR